MLVGIAVLVKGPLALVLCGLSLALASLLSTDARRRLLALNWVRGLLLAIAVALPWFWFMFARFGRSFITGYVLDENVRLFAGSRFGNQPRSWFYFQILAAGLLPWTGLVVGRTSEAVKVVENALVKAEPEELKSAEIVQEVKAETSLMPEGLLNQLTREEILDLLAFVVSRGNRNHEFFQGGCGLPAH